MTWVSFSSIRSCPQDIPAHTVNPHRREYETSPCPSTKGPVRSQKLAVCVMRVATVREPISTTRVTVMNAAILGILGTALLMTTPVSLPTTTKRPVIDTFHGVNVQDDYRWLEDGSSRAVQEWSDAQNAHARSILDRLPNVERIRQRVTEILADESASYSRITPAGDVVLAMQRQPPRQQPF